MKGLARLVLDDWRRKLLAVLLACGLWWYVDGLIAVDRSYELRITLAAGRLTPEDGTLAVLVPQGWTLVEPRPGSSLRVRLHGSRSNLENFTTRQFAALHELRPPPADAEAPQHVETVSVTDLEWRRPDEAAHLLAGVEGVAGSFAFRLERQVDEVFELRHELLRIESEVREEYEVRSIDASFDLTQAILSGPQGLVAEAREEIRRATLDPGTGADLFATIRLPQSTRREAVVLLALDPAWSARGLRMDPEWVRVEIPVQLRVNAAHVWTPPLRVVSETPQRWQVPAYAAEWRAELRYDVLQAGIPFKEWIEQHLLLFLSLPTLRASGQDVAEARVEWTLVDVDERTRAALLDALIVRPVKPESATVLVTRIP